MRFVGGILTPPVAHAKELYIDQKNDVTKRNCTLSKPLSSHNLLKPKPRLRLGKVTKHDYALTKNTKRWLLAKNSLVCPVTKQEACRCSNMYEYDKYRAPTIADLPRWITRYDYAHQTICENVTFSKEYKLNSRCWIRSNNGKLNFRPA